jgi:hypothetical protein
MGNVIRGGRQVRTDELGTITVTTNNRERELKSWHDLSEEDRADFDYVTDEDERYSPRFVRFRGDWYDTDDTEGLAPHRLRALGWSTYLSTSFFDGIVFRHFTMDGDCMEDTVVVGHYVV